MLMKHHRRGVWGAMILLFGLISLPITLPAQEEVSSAIRRYKDREASTGYYEQYEVKPGFQRPFIAIPGLIRGVLPYSPSAAKVRIRTRLADSHQGLKFYWNLRCEDCHVKETRDIHTVRANLTCRQCHGGEPIAGLHYYYSPFNPIRRHAYVCAKCHEGANVSFASYVVHEPNPALASTRKTFPLLFYVFWAMVALAGGTFLIFLPHTVAWGIREFFLETKKRKDDSEQGG
jgi:hypothetical protein